MENLAEAVNTLSSIVSNQMEELRMLRTDLITEKYHHSCLKEELDKLKRETKKKSKQE